MSVHKKVIIIGAGAGGLALANILAKSGFKVTVYEKNEQPGGRMGKLAVGGFTFDTGPSWYLMKDVFSHYFKLFGKDTDDYYELTRLNPGYKVFYETREPLTIVSNQLENQRLFESAEKGAGKALARYIKKGERNYRAALGHFLYNPLASVRNVVSSEFLSAAPPFASMFTQSLHRYVSRQFSTVELQQVLEYPSVFLGASPFNTPALYQLMSYLDFKEGVYYPKRKGMHAVTEALCALGTELGVKYVYEANVEKILVEEGQTVGAVVDGKTRKSDIVVSNADLEFTERQLLDEKDRSYPMRYWQKRKAGPSALLMYLGVRGKLPELEHHNLFFVEEWRKNFEQIYEQRVWPDKASMYVSKTTATDKSTAPKGCENIFVLVPLPAGVDSDGYDVDERVDMYLRQLEEMSGIRDLRERIVAQEIRQPEYFAEAFNSWQNTALGMSHTLRQTAFFRPSVQSKKVKDLYYVGAGSQPGIGVPMCIISAQLVYKRLANDKSPGPTEEIRSLR